MNTPNKYVAFIPARGGSKGIPRKNIRLFCSVPLVFWTIYAAVGSKKIDRVIVSTDSGEICDRIKGEFRDNIEVIPRHPDHATDTAPLEPIMVDYSQKNKFANIILIQPTSPLLKPSDLDRGISVFEGNDCDSVLSVVPRWTFHWKYASDGYLRSDYNPRQRPRRQEWDGLFVENGAFYITSRKRLLQSQCRISGRILPCEMTPTTMFEIDTEEDWQIVESLKLYEMERRYASSS